MFVYQVYLSAEAVDENAPPTQEWVYSLAKARYLAKQWLRAEAVEAKSDHETDDPELAAVYRARPLDAEVSISRFEISTKLDRRELTLALLNRRGWAAARPVEIETWKFLEGRCVQKPAEAQEKGVERDAL